MKDKQSTIDKLENRRRRIVRDMMAGERWLKNLQKELKETAQRLSDLKTG